MRAHLSSVPSSDEGQAPTGGAAPARRSRRRLELLLVGGLVAVAVVFAVVLFVVGRSSGSASKLITNDAVAFWVDGDKTHVVPTLLAGPDAEKALQISFKPGRTYFTLLESDFSSPQNWSGRKYLLVNWRGTGGGQALELVVGFAADGSSFAVYDILDTSAAWRRLALPLAKPDAEKGAVDWHHVVSVRIVGASKDARGAFSVGKMSLADTK